MWPFLFITTCETKNDLLLIAVFRKIFNPQNDVHLDLLRVAISYLSGVAGNPLSCLKKSPI